MPEHNTLTGSSLHEPKGIDSAATSDAGKVLTPSSTTAGEGELRKIKFTELDSDTATNQQVFLADGAGGGTWGQSPGNPSNTVIVEASTDFPTAVSDVITLAADTLYIIAGDIDVGNDRFVLSQNTSIEGYGSTLSTITSTTTGNLFTATDTFRIKRLAVTATSGTIFACTGGAFEDAFLQEFTINSCSAVGTFTGWYSLFWEKGAVVSCTTGLVMAGTCNILILDLVSFIAGYGQAVDLGVATFSTCTFNRCGFSNASATSHIDIAPSSANINSGFTGRILDCTFNSSATNIVLNYTPADVQWAAKGNLNLEDTAKVAQAYMHTTTTTTIGAGDGDSGNPKLVNGSTNWVDNMSDQFTISTGGRVTYVGQTNTRFKVSCYIAGTTSAGTDTIAFYIAKNDTVDTASRIEREFSSTAVGSPATCGSIIELSTNDYIELYLENTTGTNNFDSHDLNIIAQEV